MFKKQLNEGQAGDNVGLLIRGLKRDDVERGQVSCCCCWPACNGCLHATVVFPAACKGGCRAQLLSHGGRMSHAPRSPTSPTSHHTACSAPSPGGVQAGQHQAAQEVPGRDLRSVQGELSWPSMHSMSPIPAGGAGGARSGVYIYAGGLAIHPCALPACPPQHEGRRCTPLSAPFKSAACRPHLSAAPPAPNHSCRCRRRAAATPPSSPTTSRSSSSAPPTSPVRAAAAGAD